MIESLEQRRHLSATVTETYPGFYEIDGSESADTIHASISQNDCTFTLDNVTYTDVGYLTVHGNGGDDDISLSSVDGSGSIAASITGDDGDDSISLNFDGGVWAGSGNDILHLTDSFQGQAYGDAGNDQMFISGACYNAEIVGDNGNDLIDCSNNLYSVTVRAGTGSDTIYGSAYNDQIYGDGGDDSMYGGDGDDTFYVDHGAAGHIDGGAGYDVVYASPAMPDSINIEEWYVG